jgi:hypothetical protein
MNNLLALAAALYLNGSLGVDMVSSQDANAYLTKPGLNQPGYGNLVRLSGDLKAGYQFKGPFALELGLGLGPNKLYEADYTDPSGTYTNQISWTTAQLYLAPVFRLASFGPMFQRPFVQSLGLKLGASQLYGRNDVHIPSAGRNGGYDQVSTAFLGGVFYRFEQMLDHGLSAGMEFGYDYCKFTYVVDQNGSGLFAGSASSPALNPDGSTATPDFSSFRVLLSLSWWASDPARDLKPPPKIP